MVYYSKFSGTHCIFNISRIIQTGKVTFQSMPNGYIENYFLKWGEEKKGCLKVMPQSYLGFKTEILLIGCLSLLPA